MYKRCQILLSDWQEEYIRNVTKRYDLSFSEALRVILSAGAIYLISTVHPEYRNSVSKKDIAEMLKASEDPRTPDEEKHKFIAKAYFEARKAVEYKLDKVKKRKKNRR